jgi:hypothetical protein
VRVELTREGKIHATTMRPNQHKCAAMNTRTYPYWVRIEANANRLSPEGYLINNERIQSYFDSRFGHLAPEWDAVSCEHIVITACHELARIIKADGIEVMCVECTILGSNGAKIKAIWLSERHEQPLQEQSHVQSN